MRAGVCRACLNREAKAIEQTYAAQIPSRPPARCPACRLPRHWTIAPDGVVVAVCLSCVLAIVWDQRMQLDGLRRIAETLARKDLPRPESRPWRPHALEAADAEESA